MIDEIIQGDIDNITKDLKTKQLFESRNVLVTGGAGFLGSYVCDALVALNANVSCLDNFSSGRLANIDHLLKNSRFKLLKGDVIRGVRTKGKYDLILHLASRASREEWESYPVDVFLSNTLGSYKMLELARKNDARIFFASSSEIYANPTLVPTPETYVAGLDPGSSRSPYDIGKLAGEELFHCYHRQYGIHVSIARLFNSYGPRIRSDGAYARVIPRFILQSLSNKPITVFGDGKQTRSFCYVSDTIKGLLNTLLIDAEVINIGSDDEMTIVALANLIKQLTASKSVIAYRARPEDDPLLRCPDLTKAKRLLGFRPEISIRRGLQTTIDWFRMHLHEASGKFA
jgi:UDP-glucuronate decarboxylase